MKNKQNITIIKWLKKIVGFLAISLWVYIIYNISKSAAPFSEQAAYCMTSTMLIFGVLSMIFKILEYKERDKTQ